MSKKPADLASRELLEVEYWRTGQFDNPESDSIENIINKITDAPALLECSEKYEVLFRNFQSVLELGAGQGWASCMLKKMYPKASFTVTDISPYAIASLFKWEHIFKVKIEKPIPCTSYAIPSDDDSFDCVFAYSAAHHFGAHRKSLTEIKRVLKPGGHCFYFHEPCCRKWIYSLAFWRVNRLRPIVPEDVIVYPKLISMAREIGFQVEFLFQPTLHKRLPTEFLYYFLLRTFPFLQSIVPCTGTFHFQKPK